MVLLRYLKKELDFIFLSESEQGGICKGESVGQIGLPHSSVLLENFISLIWTPNMKGSVAGRKKTVLERIICR